MKVKISIIAVLFAMFFISCKDDKKSDTVTPTETPKVSDNFKVTFELIAKKDDNMHLYYTEDKSINFNETQSMWAEVKGSNEAQEVVFTLPADVLPTDIRFDLGHGVNKEQTEIVLKKFRIDYLEKSFEVKDSLIFNYFYPNEGSTIIDKKASAVKRKTPDQENAASLYPHILLEEELAKIIQ